MNLIFFQRVSSLLYIARGGFLCSRHKYAPWLLEIVRFRSSLFPLHKNSHIHIYPSNDNLLKLMRNLAKECGFFSVVVAFAGYMLNKQSLVTSRSGGVLCYNVSSLTNSYYYRTNWTTNMYLYFSVLCCVYILCDIFLLIEIVYHYQEWMQ